MKRKWLTLLAIILWGCEVQTVYVVVRNVPQYPTFVVLPANNSIYQHEFANQIESYLLGSGVKVIRRPSYKPTKQVEVTKSATGVRAEPGQAEGGAVSVTEWFSEFEEIDSDYVIFTYADAQQVQIVKRISREVLVSFAIKPTQDYSGAAIFRDALRKLGIRVLQM